MESQASRPDDQCNPDEATNPTVEAPLALPMSTATEIEKVSCDRTMSRTRPSPMACLTWPKRVMGNQVRPTSKARKALDSPPNWHKARLVMIRISFSLTISLLDSKTSILPLLRQIHIYTLMRRCLLFFLLSLTFFVITRYFLFSLRPDAFGCHCISIFLPYNRSIGDRAGLGTRDVVMNDWAWFGFGWV